MSLKSPKQPVTQKELLQLPRTTHLTADPGGPEAVAEQPDSTRVWFTPYSTPLRDTDGRIVREINKCLENHRAQASLCESEERFPHMADNAPVMIWVSDGSGSCVYLNKLWYDLTGQSRLEGFGSGWLDAVHPADCARIRNLFLSASEGREAIRVEHRLRGKDGNYRWVLNAAAPRFGLKDNFLGYIGSIIDIDEIKKSEEALKAAQEPLEQLNTLLEARVAEKTGTLVRSRAEREQLLEQLLQAQKMECVGTLASGVAHDFNNLLNIILAHTSVIRSNVSNATVVGENLSVIEEAVARGTGVVQQLMLLGRKGDSNLQAVALNTVVEKISKLVKEIFPRTVVTTLNLDYSLGTVLSNETQIHQVLLNLCLNARDAMPEGGQISIRTDKISGEKLRLHMRDANAENYAVVKVTDSGAGIDDETRRRIFEPFFTTKAVGEGSGLGLSVVYGIVQNHGGFIEVTSKLGHGTTFTIYLPTNSEASPPAASNQP